MVLKEVAHGDVPSLAVQHACSTVPELVADTLARLLVALIVHVGVGDDVGILDG